MNKPFTPQLVYFEPKVLDYPLGKELKVKFDKLGIETRFTTSHNQIRDLPGGTDAQNIGLQSRR
jgi:spore photoproduct lyase